MANERPNKAMHADPKRVGVFLLGHGSAFPPVLSGRSCPACFGPVMAGPLCPARRTLNL